jgi:hypothetical protein
MPSVTVPKQFFVKERRMYANWQFAFWRELFQNSTDAKANRIDVDIVKKDDGVIGVSFSDNGSGMNREVLENVYFCLGSTTKLGGDTVGGFGRARLLTCFSMKNYTIHTQDNLVQGEGGSYEIATVDYRQGCLLQVEIENENYDKLYQSLDNYLRNSQMYCEVYVNGGRFTNWNYRRKLTRQLEANDSSFAHVYVNKSAGNYSLLVRVSGALMYSQSIGANAQVIVEIHPSMSRDILTANRDGMYSLYSSVLDSFVRELAVDTMTALKPRFRNKNATIKGRGLIFSQNERTKLSEEAGRLASKSSLEIVDSSGPKELSSPAIRVAEFIGGIPEVVNNVKPVGVIIQPLVNRVGKKYYSNLPDVFIDDDTENEKIRKVIDQYNPENWVVAMNGKTLYNKGVTMYKLLMLWKVACEYAISAMMKKHSDIAQVIWGIGWVFSDTSEARHKFIDGGSALLLNPVDSSGKLCYKLNNQDDQKRLMALAKHEVAHTIYSYHNEEYASLLTDIDVCFDEREVYKAMREMISSLN